MYLRPDDREYIENTYFNGESIPEDLEDFLDCRYGSRLGFIEAYRDHLNPVICDVERYIAGDLPLHSISKDNLIEENRRLKDLIHAYEMEGSFPPIRSRSRQLEERDHLITMMLYHIQNLMKQVVSLRYVASFSMEDEFGEVIRDEIFSDLYGDYEHTEEYRNFLKTNFHGDNPMENWGFRSDMYRLSRGRFIQNYPFNYASMMKKEE